MKLLNTFLFLITLSSNLFAQWFLQNPTSENISLQDIHFISSDIGWIVGTSGTIRKTTDGGINWTKQNSKITSTLNSIFFIDSLNGIAVGNYGSIGQNGVILRTTDGGLKWNIEMSEISEPLNSVFFIDSNTGITVGRNGIILRTINGGLNWEFTPSGTISSLHCVSFSDNSNGFAVGDMGTLLKTIDGGENWFSDYITSKALYSISMIDSNYFYIVGSRIIIMTTDGGLSWSSSTPAFELYSVCFIDSNNGFAVGSNGYNYGMNGIILRTTNGGINWEIQSDVITTPLWSTAIIDSNSLGFVGEYSTILKTTDIGSSWINLNNTFFDDISSSFFINNSIGYAVGWGRILKTNDGGINWEIQSLGTSNQLSDISFLDSSNGYITGSGGTFSRTTDSGNSWTTQTISIEDLAGVVFINLNTGIIITKQGKILYSIDSGNSWEITYETSLYQLNAISFADLNNGMVVGGRWDGLNHISIILITNDGGVNWIERHLDDYLIDIQCIDINNAVAVGSWETQGLAAIKKTTNGGQTWSTNYLQSAYILTGIHFTDLINGYIVDNNGKILRTINGGETWLLQNSSPFYSLSDIFFSNENTGWAVGSNGTILHTTNGGVTFIEDENNFAQPKEYLLEQNYPNPFNPTTIIMWQLPVSSFVTLKVYDILGREVATLVNEEKPAGNYEIDFDGANLSTGIYFYQLQAGDYAESKKMILMK